MACKKRLVEKLEFCIRSKFGWARLRDRLDYYIENGADQTAWLWVDVDSEPHWLWPGKYRTPSKKDLQRAKLNRPFSTGRKLGENGFL